MNVGLFLPNWLGDLVMATPALRALRRHFGRQTRVAGIMRPNLGELLAGTDWLDEQWYFDPRSKQPELRRWALLRRMRRERFDMVILLTNSLHTALLAWLGGARERIGYVRDGRGPLLSGKVYPRRDAGRPTPTPAVDYHLALCEAVGCRSESKRLELATTAAERALGNRIWDTLGLRTDGRVIALNSSGAYGAAKLWPVEYFARLARKIAQELDHDVLVVCGPGESRRAQQIVRLSLAGRVFSLADQPLGLPATKECLRRSRLSVSTDSGPRHIAAAFGRPVVTLLGPTKAICIENPTVRGVNLQVDLDCIGCYKRTCPKGHHNCMKHLTVEMVYDAVVGLLQQEKSAQAA